MTSEGVWTPIFETVDPFEFSHKICGDDDENRRILIDYFAGNIDDAGSTTSRRRIERIFGGTSDIRYARNQQGDIVNDVNTDPLIFNHNNLIKKYSERDLSRRETWSFLTILDICNRSILTAIEEENIYLSGSTFSSLCTIT